MRLSFICWLFTGYKVNEGEHVHDWLFDQQNIILRMLVRKGRSLSFTTGMEFTNGMKSSFFSGKVVSVYSYLLTDRNYVSKSAVILECVGGIFE